MATSQNKGEKMNRKIRLITNTGLAVKTLNEQLDTKVIYKIRSDYQTGWFAVATSATEVEEFDTELEARMAHA
jgi:transposase